MQGSDDSSDRAHFHVVTFIENTFNSMSACVVTTSDGTTDGRDWSNTFMQASKTICRKRHSAEASDQAWVMLHTCLYKTAARHPCCEEQSDVRLL